MRKISCKKSDCITIDLPPELDPRTPIGLLFARGPIEIRVIGLTREEARLGVTAHARFEILYHKGL